MVCIILILSLIVVDRFVKSQIGRAFEALRDSPIACDCMGVSVYCFKVIAFVISAGFAGLAGCLYAYSEQYISPNTYNNELAVLFLLGIIIGPQVTSGRSDWCGHYRVVTKAFGRYQPVPNRGFDYCNRCGGWCRSSPFQENYHPKTCGNPYC